MSAPARQMASSSGVSGAGRTVTAMSAMNRFGSVAELAASQHGAVSVPQAARLGLDRHGVRRLVQQGVLGRAAPGVLVISGTPDTWERRLIIATLGPAGAAASHRAAARLHRLDGIDDAPLEVTIPRGLSFTQPGVVVHRTLRWHDDDLTTVRGIRCTTLARTLCDLGAVLPDDGVEQGVDHALRYGASRRWVAGRLDDLRRPGPSGTGSLGRVLSAPDRQGPLPDSWFERLVVRSIVHAGFPMPVLQFVVALPDGSSYRLDAAYPELRIGIEADGERTHGASAARRSDRRRGNRLRALGWDIVHAGWEDRHGSPAFIAALQSCWDDRVQTPGA